MWRRDGQRRLTNPQEAVNTHLSGTGTCPVSRVLRPSVQAEMGRVGQADGCPLSNPRKLPGGGDFPGAWGGGWAGVMYGK